MKVIANAIGYFGQVRQVGDEFEVPDDTEAASWFAPVADEAPAPKKKAAKAVEADAAPDPI